MGVPEHLQGLAAAALSALIMWFDILTVDANGGRTGE